MRERDTFDEFLIDWHYVSLANPDLVRMVENAPAAPLSAIPTSVTDLDRRLNGSPWAESIWPAHTLMPRFSPDCRYWDDLVGVIL